jgi:Cu+-exporting ATPase
MLTGDHIDSARGLNKQLLAYAIEKGMAKEGDCIFEEENIHAGQTPEGKEAFVNILQTTDGIDPKGVWFVGDGLNDAACSRQVSDNGGLSLSMNTTDKSTFFTDISLDGTFKYFLEEHKAFNLYLQKIISQNKGILSYSMTVFLVFTLSFFIAGIALSPLIPMAIMVATTSFVLFNSYRIEFAMDNALDKHPSWASRDLSSDTSIAFLLIASSLLVISVLTATLTTGGLALPIIMFTSMLSTFCSGCSLASISLFSVMAIALGAKLGSKLSCRLGFSKVDSNDNTVSNTKLKSIQATPPPKLTNLRPSPSMSYLNANLSAGTSGTMDLTDNHVITLPVEGVEPEINNQQVPVF